MNEFVRFLLISNMSLLLVWLCYRTVLSRNTFHGLNRAFLLVGSVASLLVPFLPIGRSVSEKLIGFQLPTVEIGNDYLPIASSTLSVSPLSLLYALGTLVALWFFVRSISALSRLVRGSQPEIVMGELVLRSDQAGPFSFLNIIHLPKKLSGHQLETIFKHEQSHVRLGHTYDVLWISLLRILFWFNPLLVLYKRSLQEIHEYQADALTHISFTKEHYVKVQLDQLFQLPSELSIANSFYNSINLKKRVIMIYSERTSKWAGIKYLIAVPLLATIGLMAACTETPVEAIQQEAEKVYKEADVMPEYPGGMQELMNYMGSSIKYPETAEADGLEGKVFVQFVIDTEGKVTQVEVVKGVRDDLDAEAVRVISEMPDWTAGSKDGKNVNVQLVLPISYKLS